MEKRKIELMKDILVKLEDVQNSQEALVLKIATIEIELFEVPNEELEKIISEAHTNATDNTKLIKRAIENYQMAIET